jgi:hypothetical protein
MPAKPKGTGNAREARAADALEAEKPSATSNVAVASHAVNDLRAIQPPPFFMIV